MIVVEEKVLWYGMKYKTRKLETFISGFRQVPQTGKFSNQLILIINRMTKKWGFEVEVGQF